MKKIIAMMLALLMAGSMIACTSGKSEETATKEAETTAAAGTETEKETETEAAKEVTPKAIDEAIAEALGDGYLCSVDVTEDEFPMSAVGWLEQDKVKDYVMKQAEVTAVNVDVMAIVKVDPDYADEAVEIFNQALEQKVSYIRQYPFGVAKVEGARIYKVDDIVMFILAGARADEDASEEDIAKLAESEYAKIDEVIKSFFGSVPENLAVIPEENQGGGGGGLIGG